MATAHAPGAPTSARAKRPFTRSEPKAATSVVGGGHALASGGAIALISSLFLPWYALEVPAAFRKALEAQAKGLPAELRDAGRSIAAELPARIEKNAWEVFQATDIALLACAVAVLALTLLATGIGARVIKTGRDGSAGPIVVAGVAASAVVVSKLADQPDPQQFFSLEPGGFVALAGALAIALGGWIAGRRHALR